MVHHAAIVNLEKNILVYGVSKDFSMGEKNDDFVYSATHEVFNRAKKEDIRGGIVFLDDAPTFEDAKAILSAELVKVVYKIPAETVDETAAIQLLEANKVETYFNPELILEVSE